MTLVFNESIETVSAFAPATIGNFAVGYDLLGCCINTVGDEVTLTRYGNHSDVIVFDGIISADQLPIEIDYNVASFVIRAFCRDHNLPENFRLSLKKGISLGSGMGGSAASAVAALVALNGFLKEKVMSDELLKYAIAGEAMVSGAAHADNVAPCLLGGVTLVRNINPVDVISLPVPTFYCVVIHPDLRVDTKKAREVLPCDFPVPSVIQQTVNLSNFIVSLYEKDYSLLKKYFSDALVEPHRRPLIKGFSEVKAAALTAGAIGASMSGSGPTMFALAETKDQAEKIKLAMIGAFAHCHVQSQGWVSLVNQRGAFIQELI